MNNKILSILICLGAVLVSPALASNDSCDDRTIVASTVRTTEDVRAFVQCAYEFFREVGFEEARRAFNQGRALEERPHLCLRRHGVFRLGQPGQ